jgi:hypothetical protein
MEVDQTPSTGPSVRRQLTALVVIGGLVVLMQAFQIVSNFPAPHRWEYLIEAPTDANLRQRLNQLGEQGWEIVSSRRATSQEGGTTTAAYELILRRPAGSGSALEMPTPR